MHCRNLWVQGWTGVPAKASPQLAGNPARESDPTSSVATIYE